MREGKEKYLFYGLTETVMKFRNLRGREGLELACFGRQSVLLRPLRSSIDLKSGSRFQVAAGKLIL